MKKTLTKTKFYSPEERKIALSDKTVKEITVLLPGRSEQSIYNFRYNESKKASKGLSISDTNLSPQRRAAITRKKNRQNIVKSLQLKTQRPEIEVINIVEKPRTINFVIDGISVMIDRLVHQIIVSKDNIVINR